MLLQKLRNLFLPQPAHSKNPVAPAQPVLLSQLLDRWQEHEWKEGSLALGTMNNYMSVVRTLKNMPVSRMPVQSIDTHNLQVLFDSLSTGYYRLDGGFVPGYTHSHILAFSAVLQGAFRYAVYPCGIISENPMQQVVLHKRMDEAGLFPSERQSEHSMKVLMPEQFQAIVKYLKEKKNPAVLPIVIAYYTGLRLGEVCALTWEDIDFREQCMTIRRSVMLNRLEKNRLEFTTTKRNKIRCVYFGERLKNMLLKAKEEQEKNRERIGKEYKYNYYEQVVVNNHFHYPLYTRIETQNIPESFQKINLVCVREDGAYESRRTVSNVCFRLKNQLPGLENFHFHMLRHTYTSNLLQAGARPKDVQELLGHSDISTTMNVYAHADKEELKKIVGRL